MLHWIGGPMFSRKTTTLMDRLTHEHVMALRRGRKIKVCCLNTIKDVRPEESENGTQNFSTHRGNTTKYPFPVFKVANLRDFDASDYNVIGVDEGHFFVDLIEIVDKWIAQGKLIMTAGLTGTFQYKPFNRYLELIPLAARHEFLYATCDLCEIQNGHSHDENAAFTRRVTDSQEIELVGTNMYIAVCKNHQWTPLSSELLAQIKLNKSR